MKHLTKHGKKRIHERVGTNFREISLVKNAIKNGNSPNVFYDSFHDYLYNKETSRIKVKVYQNKIYFITKNSHRLITVYPVPEKYLPVEQYLVPCEIYSFIQKIISLNHKPVTVTLHNNVVINGILDIYDDTKLLNKINIIKYDNTILTIKIKKVLSIELDNEHINLNFFNEELV